MKPEPLPWGTSITFMLNRSCWTARVVMKTTDGDAVSKRAILFFSSSPRSARRLAWRGPAAGSTASGVSARCDHATPAAKPPPAITAARIKVRRNRPARMTAPLLIAL
jgi:hypothetical protein